MLTLMSIKNNYDDFGIVIADEGTFDPSGIRKYIEDHGIRVVMCHKQMSAEHMNMLPEKNGQGKAIRYTTVQDKLWACLNERQRQQTHALRIQIPVIDLGGNVITSPGIREVRMPPGIDDAARSLLGGGYWVHDHHEMREACVPRDGCGGRVPPPDKVPRVQRVLRRDNAARDKYGGKRKQFLRV